MLNVLSTELMKMKRSKMLLISVAGILVVPLLNLFIGLDRLKYREYLFGSYFGETLNVFVLLGVGTMLFGLLATHLFTQEFQDDTMKNILTIPIKRRNVVISKLIILFGWIEFLMLLQLILCIAFGLIGGFSELTTSVILKALTDYLYSGALLFLLTPAVILVTLLFKNYIPSIAFVIIVTFAGLIALFAGAKYALIYPWTAPIRLISSEMINIKSAEFTSLHSFLSIATVFVVGAVSSITYFRKTDIH